jgi:hypothetical protein
LAWWSSSAAASCERPPLAVHQPGPRGESELADAIAHALPDILGCDRERFAVGDLRALRYYAVGAKSYGRAPTFLLATGYEQARSVVAALAGDWDAARDVQLDLPETGVCSSNLAYPGEETTGGGCCGPSTRLP